MASQLLAPALLPGDLVAVVSPAGPAPTARVAAGLQTLADLGFRARVFEPEGAPRSYLAGSDQSRAQSLLAALTHPDVRGVWCLRGGFGAIRTLAVLAGEAPAAARMSATGLPETVRTLAGPEAPAAAAMSPMGLPTSRPGAGALRSGTSGIERALSSIPPRVFVGFSDITALHAVLPWPSFHGPVITQLPNLDDASRRHACAMFAGETSRIPLDVDRCIYRPGRAQGRLVGGNLTVLTSLLGTPFFPDLAGGILFLEDVAEPPYRVDRMLFQLRLAGALDGILGLVLGQFTHVPDALRGDFPSLWAEVAHHIDGPVLDGLPVGHGTRNVTVPVSARAALDTDRAWIELLEPVVAPR